MPKQSNITEMMNDAREDDITSMNNPNCVNCNECCSMGTMLTDEEFHRIKRFLKRDKRGKMLLDRGQNIIREYFKKSIIYWLCPFSRDFRCMIYNTRPNICKVFHCDEPEASKGYRDLYANNSKTIGDLFCIMDVIKQVKKGD